MMRALLVTVITVTLGACAASDEAPLVDASGRDSTNDAAPAPAAPPSSTGAIFRDRLASGGEGPEMVEIPAGRFLMGSPPEALRVVIGAERSRPLDGEEPQHEVTIPAFAAGRYEVTFEQWDACHDAGACRWIRAFRDGVEDPERRGTRPIESVSWDDAQAYVRWLSMETGQPYRLLSEAEWEYVARAGTTSSWSWGDDEELACRYANLNDRSLFGDMQEMAARTGARRLPARFNDTSCDDGFGLAAAPVGSFLPNGFGLHDMHGNVQELVEDCIHEDYSGAPTDGSAWTTGDCSWRVQRGGNQLSDARYARSAARNWSEASIPYGGVGFRVARTLSPD